MDTKSLSKLIRMHRKEAGITQKQLAEMAGVGKTFIFDLEKGKTTISLDKLFKVFKVLNISLFLKSALINDDKIKIDL